MKKTSSIAIVALMAFVGTTSAFAQKTRTLEKPTTPREVRLNTQELQGKINGMKERAKEEINLKREGLKERAQNLRETASTTKSDVRENMRAKIQEKKDEVRNKLEAKKAEIAKAWGEKTLKRIDETILRLQKTADRIDSRIVKMKANHIDTTKAEVSVTKAKEQLSQAKEKLSAAKLSITDLVSQTASTTVQSTEKNVFGKRLQNIKDQTRTIIESLKIVHQSLVQAVTELKGKEGINKGTATTTKEVTAN